MAWRGARRDRGRFARYSAAFMAGTDCTVMRPSFASFLIEGQRLGPAEIARGRAFVDPGEPAEFLGPSA